MEQRLPGCWSIYGLQIHFPHLRWRWKYADNLRGLVRACTSRHTKIITKMAKKWFETWYSSLHKWNSHQPRKKIINIFDHFDHEMCLCCDINRLLWDCLWGQRVPVQIQMPLIPLSRQPKTHLNPMTSQNTRRHNSREDALISDPFLAHDTNSTSGRQRVNEELQMCSKEKSLMVY